MNFKAVLEMTKWQEFRPQSAEKPKIQMRFGTVFGCYMPYKQALHWTSKSPHPGQWVAGDPWSNQRLQISPDNSGKPLYPVGFSTIRTAAIHGPYSALFFDVLGSKLGTNPCLRIYNTLGHSESGFLSSFFMLCVYRKLTK